MLCDICLDKECKIALNPCGHIYCEDCSEKFNTCPNCRQQISGRLRIYLNDEESKKDANNKPILPKEILDKLINVEEQCELLNRLIKKEQDIQDEVFKSVQNRIENAANKLISEIINQKDKLIKDLNEIKKYNDKILKKHLNVKIEKEKQFREIQENFNQSMSFKVQRELILRVDSFHLDREIREISELNLNYLFREKVNNFQVGEIVKDNSIRTFNGHENYVHALAVLSNYRIASGSYDQTIKIWNTRTSECIKTLNGHTDLVYCLAALSNDRLASGSKDKTIKIWNIKTGECIKTLLDHLDSIQSLAVLSDERLISASSDKTIKIWNTNTFSSIRTLVGHTNSVNSLLVLSRKGLTNSICTLLLLGENKIASASSDKTIKIWNTISGECIRTLCEDTSYFHRLVKLANSDHIGASIGGDKTIKIWDLSTGKCIRTLEGHTDRVYSVLVLSIDRLASGSYDNTIRIWNTKTGECIRTLNGHTGYVMSLVTLSNNILVSASGDSTIKFWNI